MRKISTLVTAVAASVALAAPTASVATAAPAAPVTAAAAVAERAGATMKLARSAAYSHAGQKGVTITATVREGAKPATGKVAFSVDGQKLGKKKLRKGKAKVTLPSTLLPGGYKVKAKFGKVSQTVKVRVYDSALSVSSTAFTISKATPSYELPSMTGTVKFKNKVATKGYVDIYQDGKVKGGSSSPHYCCMTGVRTDGSFEFYGSNFLDEVQQKPVGVYNYQAFYTDDAAYADYIYSTTITVTVTD